MLKKAFFLFASIHLFFSDVRAQLTVHSWEKHMSEDNTFLQRIFTHPAGNMWLIGAAHNWSASKSYSFELGRAYQEEFSEGGGLGVYAATAWGFGYENLYKAAPGIKQNSFGKFFLQYECGTFPPIINPQFRIEYLDNFRGQNYLRPSVGLSLYFLDFIYAYNFRLSAGKEQSGHMFTLRIKTYLGKDKYYSPKKSQS